MNFKNRAYTVLLCLTYLFLCTKCNSQSAVTAGKTRALEVTLHTDLGATKGYVCNITDTTVTLSSNYQVYMNDSSINRGGFKTFNYNDIIRVTREKKGSAWIGLIVGAVTGAVVGLASYSKPDSHGPQFRIINSPAIPATVFGLIGGLAGVMIGAVLHEQKFSINKNRSNFEKFELNVLSRVYEKE